MEIVVEGLPEPIPATEGSTILDALRAADVPFPYSCQSGNCGTCKCELIEGDVLELERSEFALSDEERARNVILACRTQVWGPTKIRRLAEDDLVLHPSRVMTCKVVGVDALTHDIRGVRLAIDGAPLTFSAGQYVDVELPDGTIRPYSLANRPDEAELVLHVRRVSGGRASNWIADRLAAGDTLRVTGPNGINYLRGAHAGPVVLVAGGSGLAPILSILRTLLATKPDAPVRLFFGVRAERDVYAEATLAALAAAHPSFRYTIVLSEETSTSRPAGMLHQHLESIPLDPDTKVYLAGPPPLVEAATEILKARGVAARDLHADAFYHRP